jgi:hypothetical protein
MTSPRGLESITRDCGRLQNEQTFMLLCLSPLATAARVFAFDDLNASDIQAFEVRRYKPLPMNSHTA